MKKILLFAIFVWAECWGISTFNRLHAQDFYYGMFVGASISQVDGDGMDGFHKIGPQGGFFLGHKFAKHSAWQVEMLVANKGNGIESSQNPIFNIEITSYYVDFALYYKYMYNDKFNAKIGLAPSVFISSKETVAGVEQLEVAPYRKWGLLFTVGGEYYFTDHWFAGVDWNYSIVSLRNGKPILSGYDALFIRLAFEDGQYYNYLKFSLGYKF